MNTRTFALNAFALSLAAASTLSHANIKEPTRELGLIENQAALSSTYVGPWAHPAEMPMMVAKRTDGTMTDAAITDSMVVDGELRWPQNIADQIQQYGNAGFLGD